MWCDSYACTHRVVWSRNKNRSCYIGLYTPTHGIPSVRYYYISSRHSKRSNKPHNDLINRSSSISPGRNLEAGDILGGRVTSGREWRSHRGQARGPLSSSGTLRSASFPLLLHFPSFPCASPSRATPSIRAPSPHLASRQARQLRSPSLPRPLFPSRPSPPPFHPISLRRATADTRHSYALHTHTHIQGDCIIHNDPTRR